MAALEVFVYTDTSVRFCLGRSATALRKKFLKIFENFDSEKSYYVYGKLFCLEKVAAGKRKKRRRRAILLTAQDGRIRYADVPAQRWLKEFFGRPARVRTLPAKVRRWLSQRGQHRRSLSLTGQRGQRHLHVRCQNSLSDESTVLLLELIRSKSEERRRRHRQLTRREREVLFWVSQSKTNQEIASILGIAAATVGKHLERVYPKLGVENRAGATAYALENPTLIS